MGGWDEYDFSITRSLYSHHARKALGLCYEVPCWSYSDGDESGMPVTLRGMLLVRESKGELHPTPCSPSNITFNLPPTIVPHHLL
jgi:hypothetical protein